MKKCFLISPIGDDGSDIRVEADALLWIAQNALAKYGFEVLRVDQIARSTLITNEIIQLIQETELCLIVLTNENPNVFYEAGRRHETGKPFIQLIRKGERLPFDVAGIRTIIYDNVESRIAAAKTIEEIQKYVEEFETSGYGSTGAGISLSTLSASLDRIERKIGQILTIGKPTESAVGTPEVGAVPSWDQLAQALKDPRELFMEAMMMGNLERAAAIFPKLEKVESLKEFLLSAMMLAPARHEPAVEVIIRLLTERLEDLGNPAEDEDDIVAKAIGAAANFFSSTDREEEGLARLEPIIKRVLLNEKLSKRTKASLRNQLQRLLYGLKRYEEALGIAEEVVQLDPSEPAYEYNLSLIAGRMNLTQKALTAIDKCLALESADDDDHLFQAIRLYTKAGRINDAKACLTKLAKIAPVKTLALDKDVRVALGIGG